MYNVIHNVRNSLLLLLLAHDRISAEHAIMLYRPPARPSVRLSVHNVTRGGSIKNGCCNFYRTVAPYL